MTPFSQKSTPCSEDKCKIAASYRIRFVLMAITPKVEVKDLCQGHAHAEATERRNSGWGVETIAQLLHPGKEPHGKQHIPSTSGTSR